MFTLSGIALIYLSTLYSAEILALIGLGLLFWGATFFLMTPTGFVDARLLLSTVYSEYSTFDRIIDNFQCKKCYYISPLSNQDVINPKKTKEAILFLSTESESKICENQNFFTNRQFLLVNNQGIVLTPPGLGLMKMIQKKKPNISDIKLEEICEELPRIMAQDFPLAKEILINIHDNLITITIQNSIFKGLYNFDKGSNSAKVFGCPIVSSIGCFLAKSSEKIISIDEIKASRDMSTLRVSCRIVN